MTFRDNRTKDNLNLSYAISKLRSLIALCLYVVTRSEIIDNGHENIYIFPGAVHKLRLDGPLVVRLASHHRFHCLKGLAGRRRPHLDTGVMSWSLGTEGFSFLVEW